MKTRWIFGVLWCLVSAQAGAACFCDGAKLVSLDQLLMNQNRFLNRRIQTYAVLTTDAKEYTRIWLAEKSKFTVLTTTDEESTVYVQRHGFSTQPPFNVTSDLFEKLRAMEGTKYNKDMSKIQYYRQDVLACGRLIKEQGELRFALDDLHIERSYLLPWRSKKEKLGAKGAKATESIKL